MTIDGNCQSDELAKQARDARLHHKMTERRDPGSVPRFVLPKQRFRSRFPQISASTRGFGSLLFASHKGFYDFNTVEQARSRRKVCVKIRVHNFLSSKRTRELTWSHINRCPWNHPTSERQGVAGNGLKMKNCVWPKLFEMEINLIKTANFRIGNQFR